MTEQNHKSVAVIERGDIAPQVHPMQMVASAVAQGLDPDTIAKLMDLADRHEATEARKAYSRALVDLKRDLPTVIRRDQTVSFKAVRYTHTSLAQVMTEITEPLAQHGFSVAWEPRTEQGKVAVTCRLTHSAGHSEEATIDAPIDNSGSKSPAQGIASTITLLQRYTVLALLGIATADMVEPEGETPPEHIDSARNMRAVKAYVDAGHSKAHAESIVGHDVSEWTAADLDTLRAWLVANKPKPKANPAKKEPPHNPETGEVDEYNYGPAALTPEQVEAMKKEAESDV